MGDGFAKHDRTTPVTVDRISIYYFLVATPLLGTSVPRKKGHMALDYYSCERNHQVKRWISVAFSSESNHMKPYAQRPRLTAFSHRSVPCTHTLR